MKIICIHCGRSFEGDKTKFCSQGCRDSHIVALEKRIREAVDTDSSHTNRLSNGRK
ncbi:MAG: hypothetical protein HC944_06475 [Nanoarchaeota archaeon]|nr:hypothetical protein [Nanoarchaeota archaeon]